MALDENISSIIIVIIGSGALAAFINGLMTLLSNWRNERKLTAETRQIDTNSDNETISSLISVTKLYAEQITTLSSKVTALEDKAEKRKTAEVDLEIRVKRLEAELAIKSNAVKDRDETILLLQAALEECRGALVITAGEDYIDN
jgi:predicted RNase H-like nuclease (RuvC/YqgF family)